MVRVYMHYYATVANAMPLSNPKGGGPFERRHQFGNRPGAQQGKKTKAKSTSGTRDGAASPKRAKMRGYSADRAGGDVSAPEAAAMELEASSPTVGAIAGAGILDSFAEHAQAKHDANNSLALITDTESEQGGLRRIISSALDRYLQTSPSRPAATKAIFDVTSSADNVTYPEKRSYEERFLHTVGKTPSDRPCRNATSQSEKCVAHILWHDELLESPMVEFVPSHAQRTGASESPPGVCLLCLRYEIQCASYGCLQDGVKKSESCLISSHYNIINEPGEYPASDCVFPQSVHTGIFGPCVKCVKHKLRLHRVTNSSLSSGGYWQIEQLFDRIPETNVESPRDF